VGLDEPAILVLRIEDEQIVVLVEVRLQVGLCVKRLPVSRFRRDEEVDTESPLF